MSRTPTAGDLARQCLQSVLTADHHKSHDSTLASGSQPPCSNYHHLSTQVEQNQTQLRSSLRTVAYVPPDTNVYIGQTYPSTPQPISLQSTPVSYISSATTSSPSARKTARRDDPHPWARHPSYYITQSSSRKKKASTREPDSIGIPIKRNSTATNLSPIPLSFAASSPFESALPEKFLLKRKRGVGQEPLTQPASGRSHSSRSWFSPPQYDTSTSHDQAERSEPALMQAQNVSRRQALSRNWSSAAEKSASTVKSDPLVAASPASKMAQSAPTPATRNRGPRQTSLMNFFGSSPVAPSPAAAATAGLFYGETSNFERQDEVSPVKRRRISEADEGNWVRNDDELSVFISSPRKSEVVAPTPEQSAPAKEKKEKRRGGFIVDSDDSDDDSTPVSAENMSREPTAVVWSGPLRLRPKQTSQPDALPSEVSNIHSLDGTFDEVRPPLMRQDTSLYTPGEFGEEDFEDDEFYEEGEEFMERRWMEEQAAMEAAFDEDSKSEDDTESVQTPRDNFDFPDLSDQERVAVCPICNGSLKGLTEPQASSHVNACLDGTVLPLPNSTEDTAAGPPPEPTSRPASPSKQPAKPAQRFQRAAVARPPQANPFNAAKEGKVGGSAFTRLMSGHAEDVAWAEAASNEKESRGKPAYQRTCPFYKIMPGMYICVDAFRYGKVEGQNAYFLSHFHSDHYIGLTANWSHGPIYASNVTCNLMRQCLRVDPKWIRPLEFEKKYDVPDTNGVRVTMIPANHCPGSSLYVFEKVIGRNKDGSDRMHRILHCGDFRACPAHVNHPLLRPNIIDAVSGATKEQWIDTCFLDTTYLTPKYAFPSQSDVIDACAAMCVSLSNEIANPNDLWEQAKSIRMGSTMTKFLEAGSNGIKPEPEDEDDKFSLKPRGRLLVVIGTYSIGKERICLGIAKALNSKIYAPPHKMAICRALEDQELNARLTSNKYEAQVHMQILFEIRAETLHDYLVQHKPHFSRVVGFRPTGWNYRPPTSRFTENPAVDTILHSEGWKSRFTVKDLVPQRGSTKESNCFGVPYSEHSSFRELTMFCCALRIKKVVPTVNVGSAKGREKMKKWIEKWEVERRKKGVFEWTEKGGSGGDSERFEGLHYGV